jgi:hypothetical protein
MVEGDGATPLISWPRKPGHVSSGFGSRGAAAADAAALHTNATTRVDRLIIMMRQAS